MFLQWLFTIHLFFFAHFASSFKLIILNKNIVEISNPVTFNAFNLSLTSVPVRLFSLVLFTKQNSTVWTPYYIILYQFPFIENCLFFKNSYLIFRARVISLGVRRVDSLGDSGAVLVVGTFSWVRPSSGMEGKEGKKYSQLLDFCFRNMTLQCFAIYTGWIYKPKPGSILQYWHCFSNCI